MPRPLEKPPLYRLTLTEDAFRSFRHVCPKYPSKGGVAVIRRPNGKWDMPISFNLLDQLQTAALPKENLSDTVLRLAAKAKGNV